MTLHPHASHWLWGVSVGLIQTWFWTVPPVWSPEVCRVVQMQFSELQSRFFLENQLSWSSFLVQSPGSVSWSGLLVRSGPVLVQSPGLLVQSWSSLLVQSWSGLLVWSGSAVRLQQSEPVNVTERVKGQHVTFCDVTVGSDAHWWKTGSFLKGLHSDQNKVLQKL